MRSGWGNGEMWDEYVRFRPRFAEAMDGRLYPIEYLDALVWSGRAQFLSEEDSAIVFEAKTYPSGALAVEGVIAAGELDGIRKLIAKAEAWGRAHGAIIAKIDSRSGWVRTLKGDGYAMFQTSLVKELN